MRRFSFSQKGIRTSCLANSKVRKKNFSHENQKEEERIINISENHLKNDRVFYLAIHGKESFKETIN